MEHRSAFSMLPLGEQLVQEGLLTQSQLDHALEIQEQSTDKLLGQVLIEANLIDPQVFQKFLQARISIQQPLGEMLIKMNYISREQLDTALAHQVQGRRPKPLGQLLVEQNAIKKEVLDQILMHQKQERARIRQTVRMTNVTETMMMKAPTREQVETIQNLLHIGHTLLLLVNNVITDETHLKKRFHIFYDLYGDYNVEFTPFVNLVIQDFFSYFLPILELDISAQRKNYHDIVDQSFFQLMRGFQRLIGEEPSIQENYLSTTLLSTQEENNLSLRETLHLVTRSPYLLPHPSLQTLRFLFNDFWGQRSILEKEGVQIVRDEDDVDLEDFFRPQTGDLQSDLVHIQKMEHHIYEQILQTSQELNDAGPLQLESRIGDLIEFYVTLLQTHKDEKGLRKTNH